MRILLIEDTVQDRELVQTALQDLGLDSAELAIDGGQAIEMLTEAIRSNRGVPDAMILDLNLPLVSGHEVLRFAKRTPELRSTKVIVLSRLSSENEIQVCYYMGATRYIHKTGDLAELKRELRSALLDSDLSREAGD